MALKRKMLVVLAGPPCAGKSTAARGLQARDLGAELVVIEADAVYSGICEAKGLDTTLEADDHKASQTAAVWRASREAILTRVSKELQDVPGVSQDRIVCVDDTSEHRSWRRKLAAIARASHAALLVAEMHIPYDASLARNSHRPDATRVPAASVRRVCDMLATTSRLGSGSSAWESAFRARIDSLLPESQVVDQLEAAIGKSWTNKLPELVDATPARSSAVNDVDQQLRKATSAIIKQLRTAAGSSSSREDLASDSREDLVAAATEAIRERLCGRSPADAVREAASLLSHAKREALLAVRATSEDHGSSEAAAASASSSTANAAMDTGISAFLAELAGH